MMANYLTKMEVWQILQKCTIAPIPELSNELMKLKDPEESLKFSYRCKNMGLFQCLGIWASRIYIKNKMI